MKERFWQLYLLRCGDGTLYTGIAVDARKRLEMHRSGKGAKYTRGRGPLKMVYVEQCDSHSAALRRELEARGHTCTVADALSFGPKHFSEAVSHLHTIAYRYFPKIYGMGYRKKEERVLGEDETSFEYKMNAVCVPRLYRYLLQNGFDATSEAERLTQYFENAVKEQK